MDEAPSHVLAGKRIVIAGAGIAGLSFAIALRNSWASHNPNDKPPSVQIFERDTQEEAVGRLGYSLSLRAGGQSSGIEALQKLGLLDETIKVAITNSGSGGSGFCIWQNDFDTVLKVSGPKIKDVPVSGLRIQRSNLRRVLIQASGNIEWNCGIESVEEGGETVRIATTDGRQHECDLLIAADGASSKIRTILRPDDKLNYLGLRTIIAESNFGAESPPNPVASNWGLLPDGHGSSAFCSMVDEHNCLWSITYQEKELLDTKLPPHSKDEAAEILQLATNQSVYFSRTLVSIQEKTDPQTLLVLNNRDKQPFNHASDTKVLYIGDSNHAVSPFSGSGANLALGDGLDLAEALCTTASIAEAVRIYDAKAVPRSRQIINASHYLIAVISATGWMHSLYMFLFRILSFVLKLVL
jgi:2-polyprenyl-6-methoxyphenol hydroxylase-like FAD-dependent oxidoreductase